MLAAAVVGESRRRHFGETQISWTRRPDRGDNSCREYHSKVIWLCYPIVPTYLLQLSVHPHLELFLLLRQRDCAVVVESFGHQLDCEGVLLSRGLFDLRPLVLEPDFDLSLVEAEFRAELLSSLFSQISIFFKLPLRNETWRREEKRVNFYFLAFSRMVLLKKLKFRSVKRSKKGSSMAFLQSMNSFPTWLICCTSSKASFSNAVGV